MMSALKEEAAEYDDFMLLDIEEEYSKLPYKTLVLTYYRWSLAPFSMIYWLLSFFAV